MADALAFLMAIILGTEEIAVSKSKIFFSSETKGLGHLTTYDRDLRQGLSVQLPSCPHGMQYTLNEAHPAVYPKPLSLTLWHRYLEHENQSRIAETWESALSKLFFLIINLSPCSRSLNQIIGMGYETDNSSKLTIAKPQSIYRYYIYFPKNYYLCFLNEGKLKLLPNIFSIGISSQNFWQSLIIFSLFKMFY